MRKFQPLHRRFNASQGVSLNANLMLGENQTQPLFFGLGRQYREQKLIEQGTKLVLRFAAGAGIDEFGFGGGDAARSVLLFVSMHFIPLAASGSSRHGRSPPNRVGVPSAFS